jgi:transposase InsO family protein
MADGQTFRDRVQAMGIEQVFTAPRSPWQNAYVERIIGSIPAKVSITSSFSMSVTCAVCRRRIFNIITRAGLIFR